MFSIKNSSLKLLAITLLLTFTLYPVPSQARIEWESTNTWKAAEAPIDIALSADGDWCFLLTEKSNVLIYTADGRLEGSIKVSPSISAIDISPAGEKLYLINKDGGTVEEISISFIVKIDPAGSPFLGPANAPVVITVFSDFQ